MKTAITGVPRSGKTHDAGPGALHTDDALIFDTKEQAMAVVGMIEMMGEGKTIEGTLVPRGLRRWLKLRPSGRPLDVVRVKRRPVAPVGPEQVALGKGVMSVMYEIAPELRKRGVRIEWE
jgi:hypothetical protein